MFVMKKKRITYGVFGMMEYQAVIKLGRASLKVLFTDGSITALGQNPAVFTTSDFVVQHAIEHSSDFRRGRIKVVNVVELDDVVRIERNADVAAGDAAGNASVNGVGNCADGCADCGDAAVGALDGSCGSAASAAVGASASVASVAVDGCGSAVGDGVGADGGCVAASMPEVEFGTNQEAKDYLAAKFGVKGSLRTRAEIVEAGLAYGVKIVFDND